MEGNALRRLAQRLMAPMPLRGVVEILAEETRNVFRHDAFRFDLYDPAREMLQGVYYEDTPEGGTEPVEVASDVSYRIRNAAAGLFEGRSVLVSREGVISSVDVVPFGFKSRLSQSLMFAPIRWQDKLVAVASVQNYTPGRYRQQDLRFFEALVGQCGAAVARAQAEEELRASRDKMQVMQLRYQAILRSTPNGLCIISPDWVIQFANHALHRILSPDLTTTQELVGYPFESFFTTAEEFREHLKSVTAAILDRGSDRRELELRRLDGSPFWGEISTVLLDPAEADSGYVATLAEISERREAEIALKRERDFTTAVIDTAGALVLVVNRHGQIIRFNRACEQASGYSFEEVRGKSFVSLFLKPGNPDEPAPFDEALSGLFPPNGESYWIMRDGRRRFFAWSSTVLLDDEGAVRYIIGIGVDRTEAKRQEEALVAAESKYRALVEQSLVGIYIIQDGRIVYANPKYAEVFGYTRDELMGLPSSLELIAPVDRALAAEHLRRRLQDTPDEGHHQLRGIRKDGRLIHVELHGSRTEFNGKPAIIGVMIDVTERERSEREREVLARLGLQVAGVRSVEQVGELALHAAEELWTLYSFYLSVRQNRPGLFRTIIAVRTQEAGSETFAPFDCEFSEDDGMPGFWGGEAVRIDRMPGDKGAWWCPFTLPSEEAWCSLLAPVNVRGQVVGSIAIQSRTAGYFDDRDRDLLKRLAGVFGRALERCQAQDENALLAATIAQASEAIAIADTTWVVRYVNPAFEQITGLRREQAEGVDFRGLLGSGTPQDPLFPEIESLLRRNEAWAGRIESRGAGDNTIHEEVSVTPIRNSRGKVGNYVIVRRDISREVNLEENLRQAQKMEALGLLAGGIAHDFNNLMHIIMGYCQLALRLGKPKPKVRDQLEGVVATVKRGAALTGQLLAFSHKHISQPQIVNVNHVVEEMLRMLERLIGEDIHLEASMQRDIGPVYIDPSQFEQVVMNLAVNARDAMDEGGILRVETASARLDAEYAKKHFDVEPGEYVMLVVSDTGRGMDPETASHLFEPFYTTKGIGRGTGLGMSMVYGIVKQAGGHIVIESLPRQGTTLRVYLPRADITGTVHEHPAIPEGPADGTETVLLVEDDVDVRALTRLMLVSRGYKVLEASDGREALSVAEQTDEPIHLLLTDVVMPNMGGVELAEQFARLHPQIPIVFMSGYTNNDLAEETIAAENLNFLQKPVDSDVLAEKLREVLDRRQDKA
jgi:PAS domain S-box-containing protein